MMKIISFLIIIYVSIFATAPGFDGKFKGF